MREPAARHFRPELGLMGTRKYHSRISGAELSRVTN
jgi:hypothetical protein